MMSGHSKWATMHRKKEKIDAVRGKVFTKLGREIVVAVREGGGPNAEANMRLKEALSRAKAANMPNDNIKRLIEKAAGAAEGSGYEEISYEGFGPGGTAVIIQVMTDNKNRTAPEIRHIFERAGCTLGAANCVGWMFDRKGVIIVEELGKRTEDDLMLAALDAGAEDISGEDGIYEILTAPADITAVREALEKAGVKMSSAEVMLLPQTTTAVDGETAEKLVRLIETLEEHEDVQNVYHNADIPEEFV
jgi:YebC/PmpR family DNA-binding regulatory protein